MDDYETLAEASPIHGLLPGCCGGRPGTHGAGAGTDAADPELQAAKAQFEEAQILYLREQWDDAAAKFLSAYDKKAVQLVSLQRRGCVREGEEAGPCRRHVPALSRQGSASPRCRRGQDPHREPEGAAGATAPGSGNTEKAPAPAAVLPTIATKGLVIIESKPTGATIYLDDKSKGTFATTPWQGSLEPKPVKLIFEAQGFKPEEREITPRTDKVVEIYIALSEQHFLGWIEVIANVPGADVFIDRQDIGAIGKTPYTGHLKPGKHILWVARAGYQPSQKEINVEPGTATTHTITLETVELRRAQGRRPGQPRRAAHGRRNLSPAPCPASISSSRANIRLAVQKEGMEAYTGKLVANRADETTMDMQFSPKPPRTKAWTYAVLSALSFGIGIYLGVKGMEIKDQINKRHREPCKARQQQRSRASAPGEWYYVGADVALGVGVLTGLLSLWNFLESGPPSTATVKNVNLAGPEPKQLSLVPFGLPDGAGLAATGRF